MLPFSAAAWIECPDSEPIPIAGPFQFGRSEECQVLVNSPKASRRHAAIHTQRRGTGLEHWLMDLGSSNGTFVNGRRIVRPTELQDGDQIRIAGLDYVFRAGASGGGPDATSSTFMTVPESRHGSGWLLVADVMNSTPLVQSMAPDQLAAKLNRWLRVCSTAIEAGGGTINQYLGDGFFAYWEGGESRADRVVATIQRLRSEQPGAELPFRFVLHYGEFTITTEPAQGIESLISSSVHYIFRAEKVGGATGTAALFTSAAREALGSRLTLTPLKNDFELKGFEGRHVFFELP